MKITIQRRDYTAALDAVRPLAIDRKLNEPSVCQLWLSLPVNGSLPAPGRNQSISITADDGTVLFTGYIATSPLPEYSGFGLEGPRYRTAIQALSDETLLDLLPMSPSSGAAGRTAGALMDGLITLTGSRAVTMPALSLSTAVSHFDPAPGAPFSKNAGQLANVSRAAYRVVNGTLLLSPIQGVVHPLNETDGTLTLANLALTASVKRALANDVTVCGGHEPVAYVTEYFRGDGITTQFFLAAAPYFPSASKTSLIRELFNEPAIDERLWGNTGGSGCLSLGAGGLAMNGGNGFDGQTLLSWQDSIEMGGTLLLEVEGVTLAPGSAGILGGFFNGGQRIDACTIGFLVAAQQGTGAVTVQPLIQGTPAGTPFAVNPGNQYTLRARVHCPECTRATAVYHSFGDEGPITAGGDWNLAPGKLQLEVLEFVNGVGAMPVTLYDGEIASLPGACSVIAVSSLNLIGSMRAFTLSTLGSGWVVSTPPNGGAFTRPLGSTGAAGECYIERDGRLVFYLGYEPEAGEQIAVSYRTVGRAVGRAVNSASQLALENAGSPSVATWIGSVTSPAARCSADCRNAAMVIAQAAAGVSALWSGTYKGGTRNFAADVWPGDALLLNAPSTSLNAQVVVRTVKLSYRSSTPDLVEYSITFANDWADDLAIKTSATVPVDAWLPVPDNPTMLNNLSNLKVTNLNAQTVEIDLGVTPPAGGGFEIRRRDFAFMPGEDTGLVARSTTSSMIFARESSNDRFYIRMYDGATPPNYSEFSTALFINLPRGS